MASTFHITGALTTAQILTGDAGDSWILDADASITLAGADSYALIDRDGGGTVDSGLSITLEGSVDAADYGAILYGAQTVSIAGTASISAGGTAFSFQDTAGGSSLANAGAISGDAAAIEFWDSVGIDNSGTIEGSDGILVWGTGDVPTITNESGATISASNLAIAAYDAVDIVNLGTISSDMTALYLSSDGVSVDNSGTIDGGDYGIRFISGDGGVAVIEAGGTVQGTYGVYASGTGCDVTNHGTISDGSYAVTSTGVSARIFSDGTISASDTGIDSSGASGRIENAGTIIGDVTGVRIGGAGDRLINDASASIDGASRGVFLINSSGRATLTNAGTVSSDGGTAVLGLDGVNVVVNSGTIDGDVLLGGGNDRFTSKGGTVSGRIDLGAGSDLYVIDGKGLSVAEADKGNAGDVDTVMASVSFTLGANLEDLVLTGGRNLHGTGNGLANAITGNTGDNVLAGGGGRDDFVFARGGGHDRITDFADGKDHIDLSGYRGIAHWSDIRNDIHAHKAFVVIDLGHGDTIRLDHTAQHDLSGADFIF